MASGSGTSSVLTRRRNALWLSLCGAIAFGSGLLPGCKEASSKEQTEPITFINLGLQHRSREGVARGGTPEQRSLARSLMASIDGRSIRSVAIGRPPGDVRPNRSMEFHGNTWLTVRARAAGSQPVHDMEAAWKIGLFVGAFRDTSKARGIATVLGYTGFVEYPAGTSPWGDSRPRELGSAISGGFVHGATKASPVALAERARRGYERIASEAGIERVTVSFVKSAHLAMIVDVRSRKPLRALDESGFLTSLGVEGLLLRVRTVKGEPFAVRALTARAATSASWGGLPRR